MKRACLLLICFLFISCVTLRLEQRLRATPDIADWYETYRHIMMARVPEWAGFPKGIKTEADIFLRLTVAGKREYILRFWTFRDELAKDEWLARLNYLRFLRSDDRQKLNDRQWLFLMLGPPDVIRDITASQIVDQRSLMQDENEDIAGRVYICWEYVWGTQVLRYYFKFRPPGRWELMGFGTDELIFINTMRARFWPLEDAWEDIKALYNRYRETKK